MPVYLDHGATTPMLPQAKTAYLSALETPGNASSIHSAGQNAKRILEEAREHVAATVGADPIEVVFTANGTEAVNLGIKGMFWARQLGQRRPRIVVACGEHHATIDTVEWLKHYADAEIAWVPLDDVGRVRLDALEAAVARDPTSVALISVLWANNEVGTIQPIREIAALAAHYSTPLHVDAVAAYGQLLIDFADIRRDSSSHNGAGLVAMSLSAHKIGGPTGIGALILSRDTSVVPLIHGGGQQRRVRSGTQDVAAAAAFGAAATTAASFLPSHVNMIAGLRDRLVRSMATTVPEARLNGAPTDGTPIGSGRLPGNAHFSFPGCEGDSLLVLLDREGIAVSAGSACQAGVPESSHVLRAMGRTDDEARGALRITLGHGSVDSDIDAFLGALPRVYERAAQAGLASRDTAPRAASRM